MTRTIEKTVYQFAELNDDAKERARNWYRGCIESDELAQDSDDWGAVAKILGVEFDTHSVRLYGGGTRQDYTIHWTLDPSSCAFKGWYSYARGAPAAMRAYAPQDTELHRIADELQALQRRHFYRLTATCTTGGRDGTSLTCDVDDGHYGARGADELEALLQSFADWIVARIEAERDYLYSDESVDETIAINEYEFDETGRRFVV